MTLKNYYRILIIDDDEDIRWTLKEILLSQQIKFEIIEATNALSGLKMFKEKKPDLTLLDVQLPIANGIKVLDGIMKLDKTAKVVMITGMERAKIVNNTRSMGARNYILKPFDHHIVKKIIYEVLNQKW